MRSTIPRFRISSSFSMPGSIRRPIPTLTYFLLDPFDADAEVCGLVDSDTHALDFYVSPRHLVFLRQISKEALQDGFLVHAYDRVSGPCHAGIGDITSSLG